MPIYSIAYGRTKEHAAALARGLTKLGATFIATVCPLCKGEGQRLQVYTNGCGMGTSRLMGGCDYCDATGLLQGSKPAPSSVREQVLNAAGEA